MRSLKRVIGSRTSKEDEDQDLAEQLLEEFRFVYRAFVDDNGWEMQGFWNTWEFERGNDLSVTREEFRSILRPDHLSGPYKLLHVEVHNRFRFEVWASSTDGAKSE